MRRLSTAVAITVSLVLAQSPVMAETDQVPMVEVTMPTSLSPMASIGRMSFAAQCSACHGVDGAGNAGKGPPLIHKVYEPSHHGDYSFVMAVTRGVQSHHWRFGDMPPVEGMTEDRVAPIIAFIREVQVANGIE